MPQDNHLVPLLATGAVPFVVRREQGTVRGFSVTATTEVTHGLLRLVAGRVVAQWSTARETSRAGWEISVDHERLPVQEVEIPLEGLAGAQVRWRFLPWPPRWQLVVHAADLRAFERLAGQLRLPQSHPAELVLDLRAADRAAAREFAADLTLALAEEAVRLAERDSRPVLSEAAGVLRQEPAPARLGPRWRAG
jgi:hypothetical protein